MDRRRSELHVDGTVTFRWNQQPRTLDNCNGWFPFAVTHGSCKYRTKDGSFYRLLMKRMYMFTSVLLALTALCNLAWIGAADVQNLHYWESATVVYAEVLDVVRDEHDRDIPNKDSGSFTIVLKPIATLTGRFDPAYEQEIRASVTIGFGLSDIVKPPTKGAKVLTVVERTVWDDKEWFVIPSGGGPIFPSRQIRRAVVPAHSHRIQRSEGDGNDRKPAQAARQAARGNRAECRREEEVGRQEHPAANRTCEIAHRFLALQQ